MSTHVRVRQEEMMVHSTDEMGRKYLRDAEESRKKSPHSDLMKELLRRRAQNHPELEKSTPWPPTVVNLSDKPVPSL